MPHHTLTEEEVFSFITNDFESAWNCLATRVGEGVGRGNFMFALQATILLEWASRLCKTNPTALRDLANQLDARQPRYFRRMPAEVQRPPRKFTLPNLGEPNTQLLTFIFDLVRNGQSHRYQQISAELVDGSVFAFTLGGAGHDNLLEKLAIGGGSDRHLTLEIDDGVGWLFVDSGMLYWDIKTAIQNAQLLSRGLSSPPDFVRRYPFTLDDLRAAL